MKNAVKSLLRVRNFSEKRQVDAAEAPMLLLDKEIIAKMVSN